MLSPERKLIWHHLCNMCELHDHMRKLRAFVFVCACALCTCAMSRRTLCVFDTALRDVLACICVLAGDYEIAACTGVADTVCEACTTEGNYCPAGSTSDTTECAAGSFCVTPATQVACPPGGCGCIFHVCV